MLEIIKCQSSIYLFYIYDYIFLQNYKLIILLIIFIFMLYYHFIIIILYITYKILNFLKPSTLMSDSALNP